MRVNGTNNNLLDIKITEDINSNSDSFSTLYFGKIINGIINEKVDVFIKSQPVIPERLSKFRRYYEYQIPHEVYVMNNINKNCYESITAKIYGYGKIRGLIEGDIDRYILVTEKLDRDIDIVIRKEYSVNFITNLCINILNALQTIHSCNLNEFVSFVHCDIKPNNIVFTNDSKNPIKIIDFGLTLNVFNNKKKRDLGLLNIGGSDVYMSISQHDDEIVDYMFDFQAIAWMLLLFLGFNIKPFLNDIYNFKIKFVKNYYKDEFINKIETDRLTRNNILVIGELCNYTINRADKKDRYSTDKKTTNGYYCDYNEQYYIDFKNILNKLK
jgi:serine/threonine protein kinase